MGLRRRGHTDVDWPFRNLGSQVAKAAFRPFLTQAINRLQRQRGAVGSGGHFGLGNPFDSLLSPLASVVFAGSEFAQHHEATGDCLQSSAHHGLSHTVDGRFSCFDQAGHRGLADHEAIRFQLLDPLLNLLWRGRVISCGCVALPPRKADAQGNTNRRQHLTCRIGELG